MSRISMVMTAGVMLAVAAATSANSVGLDRSSSGLALNQGSLNLAGGNYATTSAWDLNTGFQVSLMGEVETPPNPEWNFNHYNPGGTTYDWAHFNFADYPYYHVALDSAGGIAASFYYSGPTGETLDWALYYTDTSGSVQTVLGGTMENPNVDASGNFSAFLRVSPTCTYRTFDGTGEGLPNTVEIWGGLGKKTDLVGYAIGQPGQVAGDTWTSTGDITFTPVLVPEPLTVFGVFAGVTGLAGYVRRRRSA